MTHYKINDDCKIYELVPINMIGVTKPIINAVKSLNCTISDDQPFDYSGPNFGKLNRLDHFKNFWSIKLEPIKLKFNGECYEIVDGRHRVALSIANDLECIPAIFI